MKLGRGGFGGKQSRRERESNVESVGGSSRLDAPFDPSSISQQGGGGTGEPFS